MLEGKAQSKARTAYFCDLISVLFLLYWDCFVSIAVPYKVVWRCG